MLPYGDCARRKTSLCVQEVHLGVSLFAVKTARETPCTQVWAHLCISEIEMPCATDEIGRPVPFTCVHCFALGEKKSAHLGADRDVSYDDERVLLVPLFPFFQLVVFDNRLLIVSRSSVCDARIKSIRFRSSRHRTNANNVEFLEPFNCS